RPLLTGARIKITRSFLIGGAPREHTAASSGTRSNDYNSSTHQHQHQQDKPDDPAASPSASPATAAAAAAAGAAGRVRRSLAASWAELPLLDVGVGVNLD
ncbi:hypothetical protein Agub_g12201, partial [Astrephomene gubernaculifera]